MKYILPSTPPLDGLHAVLAASRAGSFNVAADALGLTHGAVSRRVAGVEAWLGTAIFERHGRGVRLTPAGQRFVRQIDTALMMIDQTAERWRPRRGGVALRLSVVPSFAKLWLLPRFAALTDGMPGVRVELSVDHRPVDLAQGEADIVVRYGRGVWPGLHSRLLFRETFIPAASPRLAAQIGAGATAEKLASLPLIHDSDTSQWRTWLAEAGVHYHPRPRDRRFEDYDLVLAAAAASLGLALIRMPLAKDWLNGRLVAVSDRVAVNPLAHYVAWRRDDTRTVIARLVAILTGLPTECAAASGLPPG